MSKNQPAVRRNDLGVSSVGPTFRALVFLDGRFWATAAEEAAQCFEPAHRDYGRWVCAKAKGRDKVKAKGRTPRGAQEAPYSAAVVESR
jgi:hypothetical protein